MFLAHDAVIVGLICFGSNKQYSSNRQFLGDEKEHMVNRLDNRYEQKERYNRGTTWGWKVKLVMRFADKVRPTTDL
jgi:hypothetical protein